MQITIRKGEAEVRLEEGETAFPAVVRMDTTAMMYVTVNKELGKIVALTLPMPITSTEIDQLIVSLVALRETVTKGVAAKAPS